MRNSLILTLLAKMIECALVLLEHSLQLKVDRSLPQKKFPAANQKFSWLGAPLVLSHDGSQGYMQAGERRQLLPDWDGCHSHCSPVLQASCP